MKAQIRRWSNEDQKNYFVNVNVEQICDEPRSIAVFLDGVIIVDGYTTTEEALNAAERIIRDRKLSNS